MKQVIFGMLFGVLFFSFWVSSCGNLVLSFDKKSKSSTSEVDTASATAMKLFENADDYLKDLDSLKALTIAEILEVKSIDELIAKFRDGFRKYADYAINNIEFPKDPSHVDFDTTNLCNDNKLNLNVEDVNKYLGDILVKSVLGSVTVSSMKVINANLADNLDPIVALILAEFGLKVDGKISTDKKEDGTLVMNGTLTLNLVPFETDTKAQQTKDAAQSLNIAFDRTLATNETGEFTATVGVQDTSVARGSKFEVKLSSKRSFDEEKRIVHDTGMVMKKTGANANEYERNMIFTQLAVDSKEVEVIDIIKLMDMPTRTNTSVVNLAEICEVTKTSTEYEDPKGDDNGKVTDPGKDDGGKVVINPKDDEDSNNPGQNQSQSPNQSKK